MRANMAANGRACYAKRGNGSFKQQLIKRRRKGKDAEWDYRG